MIWLLIFGIFALVIAALIIGSVFLSHEQPISPNRYEG